MKRISPGTVTVGVFAILFGLIAAYAARHLLDVKPVQPAPEAGPELATIVIPRINLPKYARVRDQDVEEIQVPVDEVPEGAVESKSRAFFRLVKETSLAGEPLLDESLFAVGDVPMLSDRLPAGYRAVTLTVDSDSALNGMIQPDSLVDITLTVSGDKPELGDMTTMTIMQNVQVMATSQSRFKAYEDFANKLRNVTVAVNPEQANKLILAQKYGTLSVTLRSSVEGEMLAQDTSASHKVNPFDLLGLTPAEPPIPEPVVEEITKTVQIWRSGRMEEITFQGREIQESLNATAVANGLEPTAVIPVSSTRPADAKKECKNCKKKDSNKAASDSAPAGSGDSDRPTLARPIGFESESATNLLSVPVEAGTDGTVEK